MIGFEESSIHIKGDRNSSGSSSIEDNNVSKQSNELSKQSASSTTVSQIKISKKSKFRDEVDSDEPTQSPPEAEVKRNVCDSDEATRSFPLDGISAKTSQQKENSRTTDKFSKPLEVTNESPQKDGNSSDQTAKLLTQSTSLPQESSETTTQSGSITRDDSTESLDASGKPTSKIGGEVGESDAELGKKSSTSSKKDRSKLRKGKWTLEEEEYTSRIIQHFSTGMLILPEGATLRSYLAEKLNCDPMRITKKFTGACCLGRRVYHLRDRPQASQVEIEMAKAELKHLRQRFLQRVDHEQSGLPLTSRSPDILLAQPNGAKKLYPLQSNPHMGVTSPWLANYASALSAKASLPPVGNQPQLTPALAPAPWSLQVPLPGTQAAQWLLPTATSAVASAVSSSPDLSINMMNNPFVSWAWAQAAASLQPTLSCLAAANLQAQQQKLRVTFEEQLKAKTKPSKTEPDTSTSSVTAASSNVSDAEKPSAPVAAQNVAVTASKDVQLDSRKPAPNVSPTTQLRQSYEAHLLSIKMKAEKAAAEAASKPAASTNGSDTQQLSRQSETMRRTPKETSQPRLVEKRSTQKQEQRVDTSSSSAATKPNMIKPIEEKKKPPSDEASSLEQTGKASHTEDEEAGTILFGFLQSLQNSYEKACTEEEQGLIEKKRSQIQNGEGIKVLKEATVKSDEFSKSRSSSKASKRKRRKESRADVEQTLRKLGNGVNGVTDASSTPKCATVATSQHLARTESPNEQTPPASVTDTSTLSRSETSSGTSSQRNESSSSLDDSDSKSDKTDPSSSEESDKDSSIPAHCRSQLPPRKRLKARHQVHEFTTQNVLEHSKRMTYELDRPSKKKRKY